MGSPRAIRQAAVEMRSEVLLAGSVERAIDGVSETADAVTATTHAQIPLWQIGCGVRSVGTLISMKHSP